LTTQTTADPPAQATRAWGIRGRRCFRSSGPSRFVILGCIYWPLPR